MQNKSPTLEWKNLLKTEFNTKGIVLRQSFPWCWKSFEAWSCMWLTTQSIKTSFFFAIWEIFKKLDSLIALTICTKQTFPIRQTQQQVTPTTGSPETHSISLKLQQGKARSSPAQITTGYTNTQEHEMTGNNFQGKLKNQTPLLALLLFVYKHRSRDAHRLVCFCKMFLSDDPFPAPSLAPFHTDSAGHFAS